MPCSTCGPNPPVVVLPPVILPPAPCAGSEPCAEVQDAACVAYTGAQLSFLSIEEGDRLNAILTKINQHFAQVGAGMVSLQGSRSIAITGAGTAQAPFAVRAILDSTQPRNLLTATSTGLAAVIDEAELARLFTLIAATPTLQAQFCAICGPVVVAPVAYDRPTQLLAVPGPAGPSARLNWTYAAGGPQTPGANLVVQYRLARVSGAPWQTAGSPFSATTTTTTVPGLADNRLYEFQVINLLDPLGNARSNSARLALPTPIGAVSPQLTDSTFTVSFADLGLDVDEYELQLSRAGAPPVTFRQAAVAPGTVLSHTFAGLVPSQAYHLLVLTHVDAFTATANAGDFTTPAAVGNCPAPLGVTATYDEAANALLLTIPLTGNPTPNAGWTVRYRDYRYLSSPTPDSSYPERTVNTTSRLIALSTGIVPAAQYAVAVVAQCATGPSPALQLSLESGSNCAPPAAAGIQATVLPVTSPSYTASILLTFAAPTGRQATSSYVVRVRPLGSTGAYLEQSFDAGPFTFYDESFDPAASYEGLLYTQCFGQPLGTGSAFTAAPAPAAPQLRYQLSEAGDAALNQAGSCHGGAYTVLFRRVSVALVTPAGVSATNTAPVQFTFAYTDTNGEPATGTVLIPAGQSTASATYRAFDRVADGPTGPCLPQAAVFGGISAVSVAGISPY